MRLQKGDKVRANLTSWLAKQKKLLTEELEGEVKVVTAKAVLLDAHASVRESSSCLRCRREITNPISLLVGYGPWCSDQLGIPRPEKLTPEVIEEVKRRIAQETRMEIWVPISQASFTVLNEKPQPVEAGAPWTNDF